MQFSWPWGSKLNDSHVDEWGEESNRSQEGGEQKPTLNISLITVTHCRTERQRKKKGELRKEEWSRRGREPWWLGLLSLYFDSGRLAVSDQEEMNMSLTIYTLIHLPLQHAACVFECNCRRDVHHCLCATVFILIDECSHLKHQLYRRGHCPTRLCSVEHQMRIL